MNRFKTTERLGINQVENIFLNEFQWIPRNVLQSDVGIDMEVEICDNGTPTGQLLGIQIKSGTSFFKNNSHGDVVYRGTLVHLNYWLNHSLPIIIILHNPMTKLTIWQQIEEKKIKINEKGWSIEIPTSQVLNKSSKNKIEKLNKYPLYFQRLQRLAVHRKLMSEIQSEESEKIVVHIEKWVNKTIGRASIEIIKIENDGNEILLNEGSYIHFSIEDLNLLFPWAEFQIDDDYYAEHDYNNFMDEYGIWDHEEKKMIGEVIDYRDYKSRLANIRPIEDGSGEIHLYRLIFSLNPLGEAFLKVNDFLEFGTQLKINFDN